MTESPGNIGAPNCMTAILVIIGILSVVAGIILFTGDNEIPPLPDTAAPTQKAAAPTSDFRAPTQR